MGRRIKILRVSSELFCQLFRDGTGMVSIAENPLPADARIVDAWTSLGYPDVVQFAVESASYPEVDGGPGGSFPRADDVVFRREPEPASGIELVGRLLDQTMREISRQLTARGIDPRLTETTVTSTGSGTLVDLNFRVKMRQDAMELELCAGGDPGQDGESWRDRKPLI